MPNTHETLGELFSDIANSIRSKTGEGNPIVADAFPDEIASISISCPTFYGTAAGSGTDSLTIPTIMGADLSVYNRMAIVLLPHGTLTFGDANTIVALIMTDSAKADITYADKNGDLGGASGAGGVTAHFYSDSATISLGSYRFANENYAVALWMG